MRNRIRIAVLLIFCLLLSSCGEVKKANVVPEIDQIRSICKLATLKCYYNNVAKSKKEAGSGPVHWFEKDRTYWIEYSGIVRLGIDLSKVELTVDGDVIKVVIPNAELLSIDVDESTYNADSIIVSKDGWNKNPIPLDKQQEAVQKAQEKMKKTVMKNKSLFVSAQDRAKKLIENYINKIGEMSETKYKIEWEYIKNDFSDSEEEISSDESGDEEPDDAEDSEDSEDEEEDEDEKEE